MFTQYKSTIRERFLRYVKVDTQSSETSNSNPSTIKQLDLSKILKKELEELKLTNINLTKDGYLTATIPSNTSKNVPTIGFFAHIDTAPDVSGTNVKPIIHKNYQGGDITLPNGLIIKVNDYPELNDVIGHTLITTDGTTLLGADDKSGVTIIMDAINFWVNNPDIPHGKLVFCFNPDEEVGRGTENFDIKKFGADFAYTLDAGNVGELEFETFSADSVEILIFGHNVHPGYAKNKMINAIKVASKFIYQLPKDTLSPETTEGREGYFHCTDIQSNVEEAKLSFIIRDFITPNLKKHESSLKEILENTIEQFPGSRYKFTVKETYRNMKEHITKEPRLIKYAQEAMKSLNIVPISKPIRGGTDGSWLSANGLLTPNLFSGQHAIHSKLEWTSVEEMELATKTIVTLAQIWENKS